MLTRRQYVTVGLGQPEDLSIPAVKIVMDLWGVQDQRTCLARCLKLFDHLRAEKSDA